MELFDERMKERAEQEDCTLPEGFDERLSVELSTLPEKRGFSRARIIRYAAIAAALCVALTVTAFATGILRFEIDSSGHAILGRFALGMVIDENGFDKWGHNVLDKEYLPEEMQISEDRIIEDEEGTRVVTPSQTHGVEISVEDGRFMLYYQCGVIEGEVDISEELRENGGYHCYESEDGYKISVTVYASEAGNGTEFEGEYYRVKAEVSYPSGYTGTSDFTCDVPYKGSGNGYMEKVPLNSLK